MTHLIRIVTTFTINRQPAILILLGLLGTIFALPAGAGIINYQLNGTIGGDGGIIFDSNTFLPTMDTVFVEQDPFPDEVSFTLSFDLDDSVPGTSVASTDSNFPLAISNLDLTIDGSTFYSNDFEDLDEFVNGSNPNTNHQWSIFGFTGTFSAGSTEFLNIVDGMDNIVDSLEITSADLFLIDFDATLFSPPPLTWRYLTATNLKFLKLI